MNHLISILLFLSSTFALAGNVQSLRTDADGNITASVRGEDSVLLTSSESGTFTATFTLSAGNCTTPSSTSMKYIRVGEIVTVTGQTACNVDTANIDTFVYVDMPFEQADATGTGVSNWGRQVSGTLPGAGYVEGSGPGDSWARLRIRRAPSTLNTVIHFHFTFKTTGKRLLN